MPTKMPKGSLGVSSHLTHEMFWWLAAFGEHSDALFRHKEPRPKEEAPGLIFRLIIVLTHLSH